MSESVYRLYLTASALELFIYIYIWNDGVPIYIGLNSSFAHLSHSHNLSLFSNWSVPYFITMSRQHCFCVQHWFVCSFSLYKCSFSTYCLTLIKIAFSLSLRVSRGMRTWWTNWDNGRCTKHIISSLYTKNSFRLGHKSSNRKNKQWQKKIIEKIRIHWLWAEWVRQLAGV